MSICTIWRKGWDSNPRYGKNRTPDFESGAFDRSATFPLLCARLGMRNATVRPCAANEYIDRNFARPLGAVPATSPRKIGVGNGASTRDRRSAAPYSRADASGAAKIRVQHLGQSDRAISLLVVLEHRHQRSPHRQSGPVERMYEFGLALCIPKARLHATRLERLAIRTRRNLAIGALPRQ